MFGFKKKKQPVVDLREQERDRRMKESQAALLSAALNTANTAQEVTNKLRHRLDDIITQFEETTRLLTDALIMCNVLGEITTFNPAAEKLFGISHKEALTTNVIDLFEKVTGDHIGSLAELWMLFGNEEIDDVYAVSRLGRIPVQASVNMLTRHDGSTSVLLFVQDQRGKLKSERTIAFYETVYRDSFDGVLVIHKGQIVAANPAASRLFGYPTAALMDKPSSILVHAKDRCRFEEKCKRFADSNFEPHHFLIDGVHAEGKLLELSFIITVIEWEDDHAILLTAKDVTEMKRLESVLGTSKAGGEMIVTTDPDFKITYTNQLFRDHFKGDIGDDLRLVLPDEQKEIFLKNIETLSLERHNTRSMTPHLHDGETHFEDWVDAINHNRHGDMMGYQRTGRIIGESLARIIRDN